MFEKSTLPRSIRPCSFDLLELEYIEPLKRVQNFIDSNVKATSVNVYVFKECALLFKVDLQHNCGTYVLYY